MLIDEKQISDQNEIAECFNEYFSSIGSKISDSIPESSVQFEQYLQGSFSNSFFLRDTCPSDIEKIIKSLKNTSGGEDGIPSSVLKSVSDIVATPLSYLFNNCFEIGYFPGKLKLARVVPIFKAGSKKNMNNFRPISILSTISKIFEKYLYEQFNLFINKYNIISQEQCGFREKTSTSVSIAKFLKNVVDSLDSGDYCIGVFLDLCKAFDVVDHEILLKKLEHYGFRGRVLSLIRSYLSDRVQYVSLGKANSTQRTNCIGVPQGSVLGPLFFILFINDIIHSSNSLLFNLFADDTSIFCRGKNIEELYALCNSELQNVNSWIVANKLSLNNEKTVYILFSGKKSILNLPSLKISHSLISQVKTTKFLGIIIDEKLSWIPQINMVYSAISRTIGILFKIKFVLPKNILKLLYYSLVFPYLSYGIIFWGSAANVHFNQIFLLQKRAVRLITNSKFLDHTGPLFKSNSILKLTDIRKLEIGKFVYNDLEYRNILDLSLSTAIHRYPTRFNLNFYIPRVRTELAKRFLRFQAVQLWNSLPENIQNSRTIDIFKYRLKLFLFQPY